MSPGLVTQPLSQEQWAVLDRINDALTKEYSVRRQMLLTRCDVTVQSFKWSERAKVREEGREEGRRRRKPFLCYVALQGKGEEFAAVHQSHKPYLTASAPVSIARVLAAGQELLCIDKTNSAAVRKGTQCAVNKVLIGKVSLDLLADLCLLLETCLTVGAGQRWETPGDTPPSRNAILQETNGSTTGKKRRYGVRQM